VKDIRWAEVIALVGDLHARASELYRQQYPEADSGTRLGERVPRVEDEK